jgi:threonine synthase
MGAVTAKSALEPAYVCARCGTRISAEIPIWRCPACGGTLKSWPAVAVDERVVDVHESGLWRYARALPPLPASERVRLGEVMTPLVRSEPLAAMLKVDYMLPSGSYKDRGSAVLVSRLRHLGVRQVLEDSSGNAGSSIAAYSAAAGIDCEVFVPAGNSPDKLAQIKAYGATLRPIDGDRAAVASAALAAAETRFYASHNWHPDFHAGVSTLGFEIWEQSGRRAPEALIVPCGHGSLVLGLHRAFKSLFLGGAVGEMPRIFAVQAEAYSSLARAWADGRDEPFPVQGSGGTIAEGIATRLPLRGREVLAAIRESGGAVLAVSEEEIRRALVRLLHLGFYVEPTAAVGAAGLERLRSAHQISREASRVAVVLTGHGLKAGRRIAEAVETRTEVTP